MKITAKQYAQALFDLTDGKSKAEIEKSVADFARYMNIERKLKLAGKVIEQFGKIYNKKNNIIEAEVVSAEKLSDVLEKKIENYIKKKYESEKVILKNIIDPNIKGGIILKVGDEVVDGSVKGRLNELRNILVK